MFNLKILTIIYLCAATSSATQVPVANARVAQRPSREFQGGPQSRYRTALRTELPIVWSDLGTATYHRPGRVVAVLSWAAAAAKHVASSEPKRPRAVAGNAMQLAATARWIYWWWARHICLRQSQNNWPGKRFLACALAVRHAGVPASSSETARVQHLTLYCTLLHTVPERAAGKRTRARSALQSDHHPDCSGFCPIRLRHLPLAGTCSANVFRFI